MICRLCLSESRNYLLIFEHDRGEAAESKIAQIIKKYFCLELRKDDLVSNVICNTCWRQVVDFHEFWQSIEQIQIALRQQQITQTTNIASTIEISPVQIKEEQEDVGSFEGEISEEQEFRKADTDDELSQTCSPNLYNTVPQAFSVLKFEATPFELSAPTLPIKTEFDSTQNDFIPDEHDDAVNVNKTSVSDGKDYDYKFFKVDNAEKMTGTATQDKDEAGHKCETDAFIAENANLSCCLCSLPLKNFMKLRNHYRRKHNCAGYVVCCNKSFYARCLYYDHLKWHKDPEYFKCTQCYKVLATRRSLEIHRLMTHSSEQDLQISCSMCERKFIKQYLLDMHIRSSHRPQMSNTKHQCETCKKFYRTAVSLVYHQKLVHLQDLAVECDICGKKYKINSSLLGHRKVIHGMDGNKPKVQCKICSRWVKDECNLKKHMGRHKDEESGNVYKCNICGMEKNSSVKLSGHMHYFHPKKLFKCTMCPKTFSYKNVFEDHIARHTGQALHTCVYCGKTYKTTKNLQNHIKYKHSTKEDPEQSESPSNINISEAPTPNETTIF